MPIGIIKNGKPEIEDQLTSTGNTQNNVTSFTSNDSTSNVTQYTEVSALVSDETHKSMFSKISTMFKNIRYLYKMLGTADISTLGEGTDIGTVTGAISKLNSDYLSLYAKSFKSANTYYWEPIDHDVNNLTIPGIGNTSLGMKNVPDDGWGTLINFVHNDDVCIQLVYTWNYSKFYIRSKYGDWNDWVNIG